MNTSKEAHPICHCADGPYSELPCCVHRRAVIDEIYYVHFGLTDEDLITDEELDDQPQDGPQDGQDGPKKKTKKKKEDTQKKDTQKKQK